jgi:hypothetical protein
MSEEIKQEKKVKKDEAGNVETEETVKSQSS